MAAKPFGRRDKRCQRRRDEGVTARIRATTLGDSPHFTSATARRRRRSNSAAVPTGLILSYTLNRPGEVFSRAVLSKVGRRKYSQEQTMIALLIWFCAHPLEERLGLVHTYLTCREDTDAPVRATQA